MSMHNVTEVQRRKSLTKPEGVLKGKTQSYYEQMKGRGTRIISRDELHKVTPDAPGKSRFVLVDCVGVTETDKTETKSLETKPSVSTAKLMEQVARGDRYSETLRARGNRLIRLDEEKLRRCEWMERRAA